MTNILFEYLYRDASNNKRYGQAVFANADGLPLAEIESRIRASLSDGDWFKAGMVDLESCFFNEPESWTEDDHPWREFDRVSSTDMPPNDPAFPGPRSDILQFVEAMEKGQKRKWDPERLLCYVCNESFTDEEWKDLHSPHHPDCRRILTRGVETFGVEVFCDCNLAAHARCCPECKNRRLPRRLKEGAA